MKEIMINNKMLQFNAGSFGAVELLFEQLDLEARKYKLSFYDILSIGAEHLNNFCSALVYGNKSIRDSVLACGTNCKIDNQELCYSYFNDKQHLFFPCLIHILMENILVFLKAPTLL